LQAAVGSEDCTVVAEFPIDAGEGVRTLDEVGMWEQLGLAAFLQRYWADNQVREGGGGGRETVSSRPDFIRGI
jgi:ribonucleoside-triphosphate reductase (thioredoxin)